MRLLFLPWCHRHPSLPAAITDSGASRTLILPFFDRNQTKAIVFIVLAWSLIAVGLYRRDFRPERGDVEEGKALVGEEKTTSKSLATRKRRGSRRKTEQSLSRSRHHRSWSESRSQGRVDGRGKGRRAERSSSSDSDRTGRRSRSRR